MPENFETRLNRIESQLTGVENLLDKLLNELGLDYKLGDDCHLVIIKKDTEASGNPD